MSQMDGDDDGTGQPEGAPLTPSGRPPGGSDPAPWWGEPWAGGRSGPDPAPAPGSTRVLPAPGAPPERHRRTGAVALIAGLAVLALLCAGAGSAIGVRVGEDRASSSDGDDGVISSSSTTPPVVSSTAAGTDSIEAVAAAVSPAVVSIQEKTSQLEGTGSGVVLDSSKGYILTNNHVVSASVGGAGTLTVTTYDQRTVPATVVGRDPTADIAVIKVDLSGLIQARTGNSGELKVGQTVVAFGSPLGLQGSVTSGIVSALNRPVATQDDTSSSSTAPQATIDAIQTDAAINPGNSGGPLVDTSGAVIGIDSAIASIPTASGDSGQSQQTGNIGVGFAIPINEALNVADQIIKTGHAVHPVIDASITDQANGSAGALISAVTAGGPAAQAGLRAGDVITAVDGKLVADSDATIVDIRADHKPGDKVSVTYTRDGDSHTVSVTLGASAPSP